MNQPSLECVTGHIPADSAHTVGKNNHSHLKCQPVAERPDVSASCHFRLVSFEKPQKPWLTCQCHNDANTHTSSLAVIMAKEKSRPLVRTDHLGDLKKGVQV